MIIFENEVLAARIQRMKKTAVWECGMLSFPAPVHDDEAGESAAEQKPLLLISVEQESGEIQEPLLAPPGEPETLIRKFAEWILANERCPREILTADEDTTMLLEDLCTKTGVILYCVKELPRLDEAKKAMNRQFGTLDVFAELPVHADAGESPFQAEERELDQFLAALMSMRDEELRRLPADMVRMILGMARWGMVPAALTERIRQLFF